MDPKHQFAAQYVLSRAAAERRERELLVGSASLGASLGVLGGQPGGGPPNMQQPMCPSPSHSDSSSGNGRLSSAGSEPGTYHLPRASPAYPCGRDHTLPRALQILKFGTVFDRIGKCTSIRTVGGALNQKFYPFYFVLF